MNTISRDEPRRCPLGDGTVLLEYESLGSTQDAARACVRAGASEVAGVQAAYQSAGRGRRGSMWLAPPDTCLLVTYILRGVHPDAASHLSFAAGVAVADAIETQTGLSPRLKWPNDVQIAGRKVAGILIEIVPLDSDSPQSTIRNSKSKILNALVGIGLNVNVERFPAEIEETATSLRIEAGRTFDIAALEAAVRTALRVAWAAGWEGVLAEWQMRDATSGLRYRADLDGQEVVGTAVGIGDSGALLLRTDTGRTIEVFSATSADD